MTSNESPPFANANTLCATAKIICWRWWSRQTSQPKREVRYFNFQSHTDTNTWMTDALSQNRDRLAASSVGTKAFSTGGYYLKFSPGLIEMFYTDVVDIYDSNTNKWTTAKLSEARMSLAATSIDTKIFFAGGNRSGISGNISNMVDIFDNSTNSWTESTLSQTKEGLAATSIGNKAFFAGGFGIQLYSNTVDIFDGNKYK